MPCMSPRLSAPEPTTNDTVTVLIEQTEELGSALEFVSFDLAVFVRVMTRRELLEREAALSALRLLSLLSGGLDGNKGWCQQKQ